MPEKSSQRVRGGGLYDRQNNYRANPEFIEERLHHASARYLLFDDRLKLFLTDDGLPRWFGSFDAKALVEEQRSEEYPILFLGTDTGGAPLCAIRLKDTSSYQKERFVHLQTIVHILPKATVALATHARSLFSFHSSHKYCGLCGSNTISEQGGARRRCVNNVERREKQENAQNLDAATPKCRGTWYPRTDPVVIMLIVSATEDKVLLVRQHRYPPGMYSCAAGHMEHGETVEDAVRREAFEETGVSIGRIRFFSSQPWPFPHSLMLGCIAEATSEDLDVDDIELEDAIWVTREGLQEMVDERKNAFPVAPISSSEKSKNEDTWIIVHKFVPPSVAIAGQMIDAYLAQDPICSFTPAVSSL